MFLLCFPLFVVRILVVVCCRFDVVCLGDSYAITVEDFDVVCLDDSYAITVEE